MMPRSIEPALLTLVFGEGEGDTPAERARVSNRNFVRGLDMLSASESPRAKGRRLTAREALDAYGFDKLAEVATEGSALLCESTQAAGRALRQRREVDLGLTIRQVASEARLAPEVVAALEESRRRPIREYERVARILGLDERLLSYQADPGGNRGVAVRLRGLRDDKPALTGSVVIALAEAAWVAMTQIRLEKSLELGRDTPTFEQDPFCGAQGYPAHKVGYELAGLFRKQLGLANDPILSMRDLLESRLQIPVLQTNLGQRIAGATIESGGRRAVVVNLAGRNQSAYVRRATIAHELCHLLFDPPLLLRDLRVDDYDELDRRADQLTDPVEQRANAFSAELLGPQEAMVQFYQERQPEDALGSVLHHFGLSFTAARYQVWNAKNRAVPLESITSDTYQPAAEWEAREAYTTTYHPLRALADHPSRAGRFSAVVIRAAEIGLVSWDTAGEWLFASAEEVQARASAIRDLYPDVFA